jgi:hypothetical protein
MRIKRRASSLAWMVVGEKNRCIRIMAPDASADSVQRRF